MRQTIAKELSWLAFNGRVLQEAADPRVPELERLHYLGIFSNNLDEFFRVRVADARRLASFGTDSQKKHYNPLLQEMQQLLDQQHQEFSRIYLDTLKALRKKHIYLLHERQVDNTQKVFIHDYFKREIFPLLSPLLLDKNLKSPALNDGAIYFAIQLELDDGTMRYAIVQLPNNPRSRFVKIPPKTGDKSKQKHVFMVIDNIIRLCLPEMFMGVFNIQNANAYTFKLTRDAELELGDGISQSFVDKISQSLQQRKKADPVRFIYDDAMPEDVLSALKKYLNIGVFDAMRPGGRYHNSKDFMHFPNVGAQTLSYAKWPNVDYPIAKNSNLLNAIQAEDICLYYPYHSFNHVVNFLKTAALDPDVFAIHICLYRVANDSQIVEALINAVRNGKQVTAVVELQARFDEANNILAAQRLTEAGAHIIFGVPGIKVHAKAILVSRTEAGKTRYYSHIGTGNFNENTAQIYTDISLLTYHQGIGRDMHKLFEFLQHNYLRKEYQHLWVSPHSMRSNISKWIKQEIHAAKQGLKAKITLKCNNLVDEEIIALLYQASNAGVEVRLIVRGMCTIISQQDYSQNIKAISIIDRYLEHARIYIFHNLGDVRYFIASADLMTRNIDYRVEVTCPVYNKKAQQLLDTIVETQWQDNCKARLLDKDGSNQRIINKKPAIRAQQKLHSALQQLNQSSP